ncbi:MAG: hydrogenase 4 membrane subunit [Campylobacteraceae bacterium]|nr:hydrogenase 4 membrane subunit [Campylobacteraceae bacterium]
MGFLNTLSILIILSSLAVFGLRNYKMAIYAYGLQTLMLVLIFLNLSSQFDAEPLMSWAFIAFITKVVFVPYILLRLVKKLQVTSEDEPVAGFFISPIIAFAFSLAVGMIIYPIYLEFSLINQPIPLMASVVVFMMGIFGFILRNSAIKQILAYCTFENGIHLTLALMAYNSPEIVDIGILTDAIFAVIIMAILSERFFKYFETLDVSKANQLKG